MSVGSSIKNARMARGMTSAALAEAAGVSAANIFMWETGRLTPNDADVEALASALGVSADEIAPRQRNASASAFDLDAAQELCAMARRWASAARRDDLVALRRYVADALSAIDSALIGLGGGR